MVVSYYFNHFTFQIMDEIEENGIQIYSLPDCDSDEDESYKESCEELKVCVCQYVCVCVSVCVRVCIHMSVSMCLCVCVFTSYT